VIFAVEKTAAETDGEDEAVGDEIGRDEAADDLNGASFERRDGEDAPGEFKPLRSGR
jgi:hypothetical protein